LVSRFFFRFAFLLTSSRPTRSNVFIAASNFIGRCNRIGFAGGIGEKSRAGVDDWQLKDFPNHSVKYAFGKPGKIGTAGI
jgi:hypothetical protein